MSTPSLPTPPPQQQSSIPPPPPPNPLASQQSTLTTPVGLDSVTTFQTDPNGPENPIFALDIFARGLPAQPEYIYGFQQRSSEVEFTLPAMRQVLVGIDVRPYTLSMNPRAHLFPEQIEKSVFKTKSTLFDISLQQVSEYELFDRKNLNHAFSYGEIHDVRKVGKNDSIVPYGFFHTASTYLGSEVWQVKRRDKRVNALLWYLEQKKLGRSLTENELIELPLDKQMDRIRFLNDFGIIDIDNFPEEQQTHIINKLQFKQDQQPFVRTNYYRVNYYSAAGGDFFYADVCPDTRSDMRQWLEWTYIRTNKFFRKLMNKDNNNNKQQSTSSSIDLSKQV